MIKIILTIILIIYTYLYLRSTAKNCEDGLIDINKIGLIIAIGCSMICYCILLGN
jgi:hypothetical protein